MKTERAILNIMPYLTQNDNFTFISIEQWQSILRDQYLPYLDPTNQIDPSFYDFYLCTILQKYSFYLDPNNRNAFPIRTLLHSDVFKEMQELIEFQNSDQQDCTIGWTEKVSYHITSYPLLFLL